MPEKVTGPVILDASNLKVGGSQEIGKVYFWHFSAASVAPVPIWNTDIHIQSFSSISSVTNLSFVSLTPETAATIYSISGYRPQVILCGGNSAGGSVGIYQANILLPANTQIWVTCDAATNLTLLISHP